MTKLPNDLLPKPVDVVGDDKSPEKKKKKKKDDKKVDENDTIALFKKPRGIFTMESIFRRLSSRYFPGTTLSPAYNSFVLCVALITIM